METSKCKRFPEEECLAKAIRAPSYSKCRSERISALEAKKMVPLISLDDESAFSAGRRELYEIRQLVRSNNFAVAVAVLMHTARANREPSEYPRIFAPGAGPPLDTAELQAVCDQVYAKEPDFLPGTAEGPIYKPFTNSFKPRSPATNNWRNSFDLQAGLGCDAPYTDDYLKAPEYLAEPRTDCVFRDPETGRCESLVGVTGGARTCFNPNKRGDPPGAETRAKVPPKLLSRSDAGYWIVPPTEDLLAQLLSDPTAKIPVYGYIAATYCGSAYLKQWGDQVGVDRFLEDIDLSRMEGSTLFDLNPESPANRRVLQAAGIEVASATSEATPFPPSELRTRPFEYTDPGKLRRTSESSSDPERRAVLLEKALKGHQKAVAVLASLVAAVGGTPLEQIAGFDLYSEIGGNGHMFEVKTWTPRNLHHQVRKAISQLYEYRWKNRHEISQDTQLYVVLAQKPPTDWEEYLRTYIHGDRGIIPCWLIDSTLNSYPELSNAIDFLIP
jgi:hypothetical protein